MTASPVTRRADGVELALKVTPGAGRTCVAGILVDASGAAWLAVKVAAPAEGGKANRAMLALLAKRLGVAGSALRLVAGDGARWKRVLVTGDPAELEGRAQVLQRPASSG